MVESAEVTLSDVARAAGVSPATASRVLHGSRRVQPLNEERVRDAAARLGYAVDVHAQATARRESTAVTIVVDSLTDAVSMAIAAGVHAQADLDGYVARVAVCALSSPRAPSVLRALRGDRPRAMFLIVPDGIVLDETIRVVLSEYESHAGGPVIIDTRSVPSDDEAFRHGRVIAARRFEAPERPGGCTREE